LSLSTSTSRADTKESPSFVCRYISALMSQRDGSLRVLRRDPQNSTGDHLQEAKSQTLATCCVCWGGYRTEHCSAGHAINNAAVSKISCCLPMQNFSGPALWPAELQDHSSSKLRALSPVVNFVTVHEYVWPTLREAFDVAQCAPRSLLVSKRFSLAPLTNPAS